MQGQEIRVYRWGTGSATLAFVGGIHGGYEINTIELMNEAVLYFRANPEAIPDNVSLFIIPSLNPDGERRYRSDPQVRQNPGVARFNANGVDLNRNFDCKWQPESMWRSTRVSGGTSSFSEPETRAIRDFVDDYEIDAIIFYHSQGAWVATGVCSSATPLTKQFGRSVADAIRVYNYYTSGSSYPVTGDSAGYFNSIGGIALEIELTNHQDIDWDINLRGMLAAIRWVSVNQN